MEFLNEEQIVEAVSSVGETGSVRFEERWNLPHDAKRPECVLVIVARHEENSPWVEIGPVDDSAWARAIVDRECEKIGAAS